MNELEKANKRMDLKVAGDAEVSKQTKKMSFHQNANFST